ncbi:adenosylmethionine--8-amino-7-oxononanoate transaminase [Dasania sp. GY-MA-18]|uniref:adenosylmethionine--8-amino-7-oxononanoate transaminase n=1 Tax=Dasania sp. GY-MA-18 TaxID=2966584 RepID=UPI0021AC7A33|nr:adenosylmethionine--8-amino-7-oxononanoate transaminase [Dasania sp. GY-MA-18]MCR8924367.1 adenosylmethionine--8-amino-7-oxononanoate transaminase [Dasania sp. GY-MA-18]
MSSSPLSTEQLLAIDKAHIWHPYASMTAAAAPSYPVVSAQGVRLKLADGRELIDGMSSWWAAIHGYNHPALNQAVKAQLDDMSHVMFGGIIHPPAAKLAKLLVDITPPTLDKVFISDSGSVAVEVAIKMALQYWYSTGHKSKQKLLTVRNGYHGDTFGAMAVCDPVNGMHHIFKDVLPKHYFVEQPQCRFDDAFEEQHIAEMKARIEQHHQQLAAVIIEPIVQGTGGMHFYSPGYLKRLRELCDEYEILLILDEIATGFGRTGKLFACEHAGIEPDIMCLGKAITGGYLSLAATLCTARISTGISEGEAGCFMHGPTFMGNPLATAVACASIELLISQPWQSIINNIERQLIKGLSPAFLLSQVASVRVLGSIGVIEMKHVVDMASIQKQFVDAGIWVRPFGKLIYIMPPYIMNDEDLATLCENILKVINQQ